jgi:hypothetical protein
MGPSQFISTPIIRILYAYRKQIAKKIAKVYALLGSKYYEKKYETIFTELKSLASDINFNDAITIGDMSIITNLENFEDYIPRNDEDLEDAVTNLANYLTDLYNIYMGTGDTDTNNMVYYLDVKYAPPILSYIPLVTFIEYIALIDDLTYIADTTNEDWNTILDSLSVQYNDLQQKTGQGQSIEFTYGISKSGVNAIVYSIDGISLPEIFFASFETLGIVAATCIALYIKIKHIASQSNNQQLNSLSVDLQPLMEDLLNVEITFEGTNKSYTTTPETLINRYKFIYSYQDY